MIVLLGGASVSKSRRIRKPEACEPARHSVPLPPTERFDAPGMDAGEGVAMREEHGGLTA